MPTVTLTKLMTLSMSVKDRKVASDWYQKHLGFTETVSIDEAGWTELETNIPGVVLGLGDMEEAAPGNCVPVFGVDDIHTSRKALEQESVKFDGDTITMEGMVSLATFYDVDGNALMLAQDLSGNS